MLYGEHAKCQAEAEYPELWNGLVGAWSPCLSPRGGTVLRDLSGRVNHGTLTNMDPATDWIVSNGKAALDFDGGNDYIATGPFTGVWNSEATVSASAWVVLRATTPCGLSANWLIPSGYSFVWYIYSYKSRVYVNSGFVEGNSTLSTGVLYHLCWIYNSATVAFFVNGVPDGTPAKASGAVTSNSAALTIGTDNAGAYGTYSNMILLSMEFYRGAIVPHRLFATGPGGWATPRRRRWNYATAQTAIPYWVFARKNARLIGGGVS